ncbi:MAG: hypothetical protein NC041_06065 [Bacteroides sp.]|nr:hypothetical protein [Prevotella sp.]MCM1407521.1 hypothetical protein [Treponema brennaborense]MCM1470011.1 hypothetical protein [Bacteroides sp.]
MKKYERFFFRHMYAWKKNLRRVLCTFSAPHSCLCCGKDSGADRICIMCRQRILDEPVPSCRRCRLCGKELVSEIDLCLECRENPVLKSVDRVYPLYAYRLWKKDLLYAWKTEGDRSLSALFAEQAAKALRSEFPDIPIVPVPPRPGKIRKHGWDQIEELSAFLEAFYDMHVLRLLERTDGKQQKTRTRTERLAEAEKTFAWSEKSAARQRNKEPLPDSVVLIDDIITTGATLESCAAVLKQHGAAHVYALTLFSAE